jgi:thiol-disulfide isomerase/thioredoxin
MKILLTAILALLVLTGCEDKTTSEKATTTVETQQVAPKQSNGIVLTDTTGKKIKVTTLENGFTFEGYENKVVILNFFATWCPPCKAEIPHLNNLQEKYKDDLVIISVLLEENKSNEDVINFINKNGIEFIITNSDENYKLAEEVGGVKSIPLMFIYDRKGMYSQHYVGAVPEEMIETDIKKVL